MRLRPLTLVLALMAVELSGCGSARYQIMPPEGATGSAGGPLLIDVWRFPRSGPRLLEFAAQASGNVAPTRQLHVGFPPYGEDALGNFWGGLVHYAESGRVIGRLSVLQGDALTAFTLDREGNVYVVGGPGKPFSSCPFTGRVTVNEYAAGLYGRPPPTREIDLGRPCSVPSITVTGRGDIAVAIAYMERKVEHFVIREFSPKGGIYLKPIRVIELGLTPVSDLASDAQGDIYALIGSTYSSGGANILEYGPTGRKYRRLDSGGRVLGFALDAHDRIFAALAKADGTTISEVDGLEPGHRLPFARLEGNKTRFTDALLIGIAAPQ